MNTIDLNGTWQLAWSDDFRGHAGHMERDCVDGCFSIDAQVPGEVHLDLERAGLIGDVRVGLNALQARWVEETRWTYRREFTAPPEAVRANAWLVFEGLDLAARIVLNGREVGRHSDAFFPCRVNVSGALREGRNVLVVHLESGLFSVAGKSVQGYLGFGTTLVKRIWLRKVQCQFEWDWAARLINVGIFQPVRLEWTAAAVRAGQLVPLPELSADLARGTVRVRQFIEGIGAATRATLAAEIAGTGARAEREIEVAPGLQPYELELALDHPNLWWPAEHGPQNLYEVRTTLRVEGRTVAECARRIGFRRVRFDQSPHPERGKHFILEVNNRRVFAKGANIAPIDMIFARCTRERYESFLGRAREAHFNFLRINGCGLWETDDFYDLCDAAGIMVWQDFTFTDAKYPLNDEAFADLINEEMRWNVRRIAPHPSLVAWCGNNENEGIQWVSKEQSPAFCDYGLYHYVIPRLLSEEDPARYYQPSTPYSFSQPPLNPNDWYEGTQHPWEIGFGDTDFHKYREMVRRFPVEGGMLGPAPLPTVMACLPPGQQHIGSFAWQQHDNSVCFGSVPAPADAALAEWFGKDVRSMSIEDFCYWGGLFQGEALAEYCDNFRRRMFDCAAACFWDFNDFWPVVRGWAILDYYHRRAPSFYFVRRALQPVSVVLAVDGEQVVVFGINDGDEPVAGHLRYGVFRFDGGYAADGAQEVVLAANASTRLAAIPLAAWTDPERSTAFAVLSQNGRVIARNRLLLRRFKDLAWPPAEVRVRVSNGRAIFESAAFAWGVCLDLDGERPLADNFFDIYPGQPHEIPWPGKTPPKILRVGNLV